MSNGVMIFTEEEISSLKKYLEKLQFNFSINPNAVIFRNEVVVISIYNSGKVLFQGKGADQWYETIGIAFNKAQATLKSNNNKTSSNKQKNVDILPRIGTDESGKGDFFGPLVTAGFLITSKEDEYILKELGVTDSKKISNNKISKLASDIKKVGAHSIVKIGPKKYNELYTKIKNINNILGWSHARSIENLLDKYDCTVAVADQFGDERIIQNSLLQKGKKIELFQFHKAESDLAVAAASILARATFLEEINKIEKVLQMKVPLGAGESVINTGISVAKEKGFKSLNEVAKVHFKTYDIIKNRV